MKTRHPWCGSRSGRVIKFNHISGTTDIEVHVMYISHMWCQKVKLPLFSQQLKLCYVLEFIQAQQWVNIQRRCPIACLYCLGMGCLMWVFSPVKMIMFVPLSLVVKGIKNGCPCIVEIRGTQGCALVGDPARAVGECSDVAKAQP